MSSYDVIVIGSGGGGGTLVHRLAPSGKRILLLERGDWLRREPQNWSAGDVFVDNRYISPDTWYDAETAKAFQPQVHYFVGGATKLYGAALSRLRAEDFGELVHHDGTSPAWPIGYDEMEPYYTQAEQLYQVHGARGEDPTEPPASGPFPYPAVSHEPRIQQLHDDFARLGYQPFHVPLGVRLNERDRRATALRGVAGGLGWGRPVVENEVQQKRKIGSADDDGVRHPSKNAPRRHRAAPGLQVGEDDANSRRHHAIAQQTFDILGAEPSDRDGEQLIAASRDLLDGGHEPGGELAVPSDDRPRALTHSPLAGTDSPRRPNACA